MISGDLPLDTARDLELLIRSRRPIVAVESDEIFFIDLADGAERRSIFAVHLARRRQDPERFDLAALPAASEGFSDAEIEAAVVSSLYAASAAKGPLSGRPLLDSLGATVPLSRTCAGPIAALSAWAHGRTVPASRKGEDRPAAA